MQKTLTSSLPSLPVSYTHLDVYKRQIQAIYPFPEPVALICHEEGKLLGLPLNRALRDKDGEIYDIIAGPFFLCGAPPDRDTFTSLTPEQMVHYKDRFCRIELYDTGRCDTR